MPASSECYCEDTGWDFTFDRPPGAPFHRGDHGDSRGPKPFACETRDPVGADEATRVFCRGTCFSGMMIALPLSLLIWVAGCGALYLLFH